MKFRWHQRTAVEASPMIPILDGLYRVTEDRLQRMFQDQFGVTILSGEHRFSQPPPEIGADRPVVLVASPAPDDIPREVVLDAPPVRITSGANRCAFPRGLYEQYLDEFKRLLSDPHG